MTARLSQGFLLVLLATALLAGAPVGCTTPIDFPVPKPTDWTEQTKAIDTYKRLRATLGQEKGVIAFYLTTFNDPRSLVVEVADDPTYNRLSEKYSGDIEGLKVRMSVRADLASSDAFLEEVGTSNLAEAYTEKAWDWLRQTKAKVLRVPTRIKAWALEKLGRAAPAEAPTPSGQPTPSF